VSARWCSDRPGASAVCSSLLSRRLSGRRASLESGPLHFSGSVSPQTGCSPQQPGQRSAARGSAGLPCEGFPATSLGRDHVRRRLVRLLPPGLSLLAEFGFPATVYVSLTTWTSIARSTTPWSLTCCGRFGPAIGVAGDSGLAVRPHPESLAETARAFRAHAAARGSPLGTRTFFWPSWRIGSAWITNGSANAVRSA